MNACRTCSHRQRSAIDAALLQGESTRALAEQYGIPEATLRSHRDRHVRPRRAAPSATRKKARQSIEELDASIAALVKARDEGEQNPVLLPALAKEIRESLRVRRLWEAEDAARKAEAEARLGARALDQPGVAEMLDRLIGACSPSSRVEVIAGIQTERDATDQDPG